MIFFFVLIKELLQEWTTPPWLQLQIALEIFTAHTSHLEHSGKLFNSSLKSVVEANFCCWGHKGHKMAWMFLSEIFFFPRSLSLCSLFILPEFQWPLQATNDCWILRNVLSELYKKPSAQRAQLKTKHANCYNFSLFWVCGKCCTDCRATFPQNGVRGFEVGGGHTPNNAVLCWENRHEKAHFSLESKKAL